MMVFGGGRAVGCPLPARGVAGPWFPKDIGHVRHQSPHSGFWAGWGGCLIPSRELGAGWDCWVGHWGWWLGLLGWSCCTGVGGWGYWVRLVGLGLLGWWLLGQACWAGVVGLGQLGGWGWWAGVGGLVVLGSSGWGGWVGGWSIWVGGWECWVGGWGIWVGVDIAGWLGWGWALGGGEFGGLSS